jgi:tetratricopeptide (TPR) repeat protein
MAQKLKTTMWNKSNNCIIRNNQIRKVMTNKILGIAGVLLISTQLQAQKANETSAAVEYKKFSDNLAMMMMGAGDMDVAKKAIEKAKTYIDLAAENETTKESPKTLFYKGEIYTGYIMAFATDTVFMKENGEKYLTTGLESYKKSLAVSPKFKKDIEASINQKKAMFGMGINMLYDQGKFKETAAAYEMQARFSDAMNQVDTLSMFNAGICYEKANEFAEAGKMYAQAARAGYRGTDTYVLASSAYRKAKKMMRQKLF